MSDQNDPKNMPGTAEEGKEAAEQRLADREVRNEQKQQTPDVEARRAKEDDQSDDQS